MGIIAKLIGGILGLGSANQAQQQANAAAAQGEEFLASNLDLENLTLESLLRNEGLFNMGAEQFAGGNPGLRDQIAARSQGAAQSVGSTLSNAVQQLGNLRMGQFGGLPTPREGQFGRYNLGQLQGANFNLGQLGNVQAQGTQNALAAAQSARSTAREQSALGFNQQAGALDSVLADRGLSRDSGVAAGALASLVGQQGQQLSQLNRELSNQAGNVALGGAQLDAQNQLGYGGLGVQQQGLLNQFTLGRGGLGVQQQGQLNQLNLSQNQELNRLNQQGAFGTFDANLRANQFNAGLIGQQAQFGTQAATQPLDILQSNYAQNYLNPQQNTMNLLAQMSQSQRGQVFNNQQNNINTAAQAASSAGAGAGAAQGGGIGSLINGVLSLFGINL